MYSYQVVGLANEQLLGFLVSSSKASQVLGQHLNLGGVAVFIAQVPAEQAIAAPPQPPYLGLEHIGLRVNGIDDVVAELKKKGAEFTVEPKTIRPGVRIAFLRGPQNVHIELLDRNAA